MYLYKTRTIYLQKKLAYQNESHYLIFMSNCIIRQWTDLPMLSTNAFVAVHKPTTQICIPL